MDKLASRFARARQYTGEKFGRAEKTSYDEDFETLANRTDAMKTHTDKILKATSAYLQPNPSRRFEASVYARLKRPTREHVNELEALGNNLLDASEALGTDATFGQALQKAGETEVSVGARFSELAQDIQTKFAGPLKDFMLKDLKQATAERRALNTLRLDLDAAKSRLKKASSDKQQQAESELMAKQTAFDDKYESVKLVLENIDKRNEANAGHLLAMLKSQQQYFERASRELNDVISSLENELDIEAPPLPARPAPDANMEPLEDSDPTIDQGPQVTAKALDNRNADNENELTITADEVLLVFPDDETTPDGWVMAERDGKRGRVPKECIEFN